MADSVKPYLPQFRGRTGEKTPQEEGEEVMWKELLQTEGARLGLAGLRVLV